MTSRLKSGALVLIILIAAFILRSAIGHPLWVRTRGMVPTLYAGDLVWVSMRAPELGDVVQVRFESEPGVYRVVGLEGQQVEIVDGLLLVDGLRVQDVDVQVVPGPGVNCSAGGVPTSNARINGREFRVVPGGSQDVLRVPKGGIYVLGDHRGAAGDSRPWGTISGRQLTGVVTRILWSWDSCEKTPRWHRIGNSIQ